MLCGNSCLDGIACDLLVLVVLKDLLSVQSVLGYLFFKHVFCVCKFPLESSLRSATDICGCSRSGTHRDFRMLRETPLIQDNRKTSLSTICQKSMQFSAHLSNGHASISRF